MKTLYLVYITGLPNDMEETNDTPDVGEIEGVVNEDGVLLSYWHSNDASLSETYHKELFEELGYHLMTNPIDEEDIKLQHILYEAARKDQYEVS